MNNRNELLGVGAIGVLLVHSNNVVDWPGPIAKLFSYGGIGVYIFVILSALGLYHSLQSRGSNFSLKEFYIRRVKRVVVPYIAIASVWYFIKFILLGHSILEFFYNLSTLSFWMEHKGAWYVAFIIPIYLLFPFFYKVVEGKLRSLKVIVSMTVVLAISVVISFLAPDVYAHLCQVFNGLIVFMVAYYVAPMLDFKKMLGLSLTGLGLLAVKSLTPLKNVNLVVNYSYAFLGFPVTFMCEYIFSKTKNWVLNKGLTKCGKMSLEMYLCNIFLIDAFKIFVRGYGEISKQILCYAGIVMMGYGLSVATEKFLSRIYRGN